MSGAHNSRVLGLSFLIHSGMLANTLPHFFHWCRSVEHRIGNSPSRFGPFAVPNRYQLPPSLIIDGSWTYSVSPVTAIAWLECVAGCAQQKTAAKRQTG